ncbi:MAG: hypothetical protein JST40_02350 [Armatimonadetes bacterium]|nr:hypothetical protein [Armatimonadota bacterium]
MKKKIFVMTAMLCLLGVAGANNESMHRVKGAPIQVMMPQTPISIAKYIKNHNQIKLLEAYASVLPGGRQDEPAVVVYSFSAALKVKESQRDEMVKSFCSGFVYGAVKNFKGIRDYHENQQYKSKNLTYYVSSMNLETDHGNYGMRLVVVPTGNSFAMVGVMHRLNDRDAAEAADRYWNSVSLAK